MKWKLGEYRDSGNVWDLALLIQLVVLVGLAGFPVSETDRLCTGIYVELQGKA